MKNSAQGHLKSPVFLRLIHPISKSPLHNSYASQTDESVTLLHVGVQATNEIATQTKENMLLVNGSVIQKIGLINELPSSNARSVEEIVAASSHLATLAENLSRTLSKFKTTEGVSHETTYPS